MTTLADRDALTDPASPDLPLTSVETRAGEAVVEPVVTGAPEAGAAAPHAEAKHAVVQHAVAQLVPAPHAPPTPTPAPPTPHPHPHERVDLAGIVVDLMGEADAVSTIVRRASRPAGIDRDDDTPALPPLAVISANLDHIVQFGSTGRWRHQLGDSLHPTSTDVDGTARPLEWLTLLDGAPLVSRANRLTGRAWPRLAGSDLADPLLDAAEAAGVSVGFVGGSYLVQRLLSRRLARTRPGLVVAGMWSPDRSDLSDDAASLRLAADIAESGAQLLVVGLGKPRQELWMSRFGPATGANVLLAFGAVVDFLADAVQRAPRLASDHGLEWAYRLAREPRRLATRYLVDDPPGLVQLRRDSRALPPTDPPEAVQSPPVRSTSAPDVTPAAPRPAGSTTPGPAVPGRGGTFVPADAPAEVAALVVTYDSAEHVESLIDSLRTEAEDLRLRVVVADNSSTDGTLERLAAHPDVVVVPTGGNLGYAAGINVAARAAGDAEALLVLNPDLEVRPGAVAELLAVLRSGHADLVVPRLVDTYGATAMSLYREPTAATVLGDAVLGNRWPRRPAALGGTDLAPESYQFGHEIDWATGAAILVSASAARTIGEWDERFFLYSEETDYFRRARDLGLVARYEPRATMVHAGAGSGTSPRLRALMAVNLVRYARKHHGAGVARRWWAGTLLSEALRAHRPGRRGVLGVVADEARWDTLPGPAAGPASGAVPVTGAAAGPAAGPVDEPAVRPAGAPAEHPRGTVVVPAHDEAAVVGRTLAALAPALATGRVEVVVVCNGCTDGTAARAAAVAGVRVVEIDVASKTAALNAGDRAATHWPRVYLDADIELAPATLRRLLETLADGALVARPAFRYDTGTARWPVTAYYRARRRLPSTSAAIWGAGVFGLSEAGHARIGSFPDVTADDYFVDQAFDDDEKVVVAAPPVPVRTPRDVASLLRVLRRQHRGPAEQRGRAARHPRTAASPGAAPAGAGSGRSSSGRSSTGRSSSSSAGSTARELLASVRGPRTLVDAAVYAALAAVPRLTRRSRSADPGWERDESSRVPRERGGAPHAAQ
ncbi:WecB/TagA/CpsF family glycosyltransferase [Georgenia sp. Z1344]|uniref:WecB/TagA/CpsF family glycosyltransferase n=1 Tax=Georgenia sp. Z1344 TaxID=3416706 RepID=UPI003CEA77C3